MSVKQAWKCFTRSSLRRINGEKWKSLTILSRREEIVEGGVKASLVKLSGKWGALARRLSGSLSRSLCLEMSSVRPLFYSLVKIFSRDDNRRDLVWKDVHSPLTLVTTLVSQIEKKMQKWLSLSWNDRALRHSLKMKKALVTRVICVIDNEIK